MIDRMIDSQTIFNYARNQFQSEEKAKKWMWSCQPELGNKRPTDVLVEDDKGFEKCIECIDKQVQKLH